MVGAGLRPPQSPLVRDVREEAAYGCHGSRGQHGLCGEHQALSQLWEEPGLPARVRRQGGGR